MSKIYETISGDTWDAIAYKVYGDEFCCDRIMDANRDKLEYCIFPAGIILTIPELKTIGADTVETDSPTWRELIDAGAKR